MSLDYNNARIIGNNIRTRHTAVTDDIMGGPKSSPRHLLGRKLACNGTSHSCACRCVQTPFCTSMSRTTCMYGGTAVLLGLGGPLCIPCNVRSTQAGSEALSQKAATDNNRP